MTETITALSTLQLAYSTDLPEKRLEFYATQLMDIHPVTLAQAVDNLIKRNKFIPTIAELREEAQLLSNYLNAVDEVPTAQMEWVKVLKAVSARGYDHGLETLEGLTKKCARFIWSSFDPRMGHQYNESACRAQFIRMYEQEAERENERLQLANSIKQNEMLLRARRKAEAERALINGGQKQIEMTATGHLIEVASVPKEPVDVLATLENSNLSDKAKELLKGAMGL